VKGMSHEVVEQKDSNSSVDRLLDVLDLISKADNGINLTNISKELNIPKTTVFRLLEKLTSRGYVEYLEQTEKYTIGLETILLSMTALTKMDIVELSIPYLKEISSNTKETSFLGVYNEGEIVYLYKSEGTQSILMNSQLGSRRPVHCTGLGKAILSGFSIEQVSRILQQKGMPKMAKNTITTPEEYLKELNNVRINGFTMDNEELENGLGCYAAPIYNYSGKVVAAICVSGPIDRVAGNKEILIQELLEAANQISRRLGFVPSMLQK
jgi:IclR family transcriptional regulator, KDG regulon repressor